jgi:uncharacterized membrane protein YdjX (TVP38/TMEM64 family)
MVGISSASKDLGFAERRDYVKHLKQSHLGSHRWRIGLGLVFVAVCIACGFLLLRNQESVRDIFESAGSLGFVGFTVAISIGIMLLLPTPILKMIAGAVFPLHLAVLVNFIGTMIGGFGAFIFGRWLFREGLVEAISKKPKLERIHSAIGEESLRISVLVRLSPIIPDEWLNYILAAGPVNTKTFTISNCASIVYCFAYAYYGWAFGQIALKEGGVTAFSQSSNAVAMLVFGLIATLVVTVIVTRVTMDALSDVVGDAEVA